MGPAVTRILLCVIGIVAIGCAEHNTQDRLVVQVDLPVGGIIVGDTSAPLSVIEFGSFACKYCATFHDSIYPRIEEDYLRPSRATFRFVSVDSTEPLVTLSAWVACAQSELGYELAMSKAFAAIRYDTLSRFAVGRGLPSDIMEPGCVTKQVTTRLSEAHASGTLGIRRVPTFLVGVPDRRGYTTGWVVEGMYIARLDSTIAAAERLLAIDRR